MRPAKVSSESGFSLIEGMIAGVILAVSLLALSSMQGLALGRNSTGQELTRATHLATDIIERIQFNRRNAIAYNGIIVNGSTTTCPTVATNMEANGDCLQWKDLLQQSGLQNWNGQVTAVPVMVGDTLNRTLVTVRLTWSERINTEGIRSINKSLNNGNGIATIVAPE